VLELHEIEERAHRDSLPGRSERRKRRNYGPGQPRTFLLFSAGPALAFPARILPAEGSRAEGATVGPAIAFQDVRKSFAAKTAVADLSFEVPRGTVYGLLGPNGAGKTTSIRMAMAILLPDAGTIRVLDAPPGAALTDRIGYLPEERGLYQGMKVIDNLLFFGGLRGLSTPVARERATDWLERFGMGDTATAKLQELSKGNQQKVQFLATVLHEPELLVLDEPFSGLDPVNQDLMRRTILELAEAGTTVILSTHLMDEVERLCSHITLIHDGRCVVEGELGEVKRRWGTDTIRIEVTAGVDAIRSHADVAECAGHGNALELRLRDGREPAAFLADVAPRASVRRFEVEAPSLHSIFVRLVGPGAQAAPPGGTS
jgi:ABC-2 type transport system ATP-binding protein